MTMPHSIDLAALREPDPPIYLPDRQTRRAPHHPAILWVAIIHAALSACALLVFGTAVLLVIR